MAQQPEREQRAEELDPAAFPGVVPSSHAVVVPAGRQSHPQLQMHHAAYQVPGGAPHGVPSPHAAAAARGPSPCHAAAGRPPAPQLQPVARVSAAAAVERFRSATPQQGRGSSQRPHMGHQQPHQASPIPQRQPQRQASPVPAGPSALVACGGGGCTPAAAAASPPVVNQVYGPGNRRTPVEGEQVDYLSTRYRCWIPAIVARVDPETGEVMLNVKQQPLTLQDQPLVLRPRTRPDQAHLKWVRQVLREGRIDEEAKQLFSHHATTQRDSSGNVLSVIPLEAFHGLSQEIDGVLGVCGSIVPLSQETQQLDRRAIMIDDFIGIFWGLLSNAQHEYGQALPRKEGMHRREDPRNVYDFQKTLGKGTYGTVKLAMGKKAKGKRAVKIISKQKMRYAMEQLQLEIDHLCLLDHPHIVKLYEYYDDAEFVYLVTDFCSGGDLQQAVYKRSLANVRFQERYVAEVMRQVVSATAHVHARGIVHLDIKSANIMIMPSKGTLMPVEEATKETLAEDYDRPHVVLIDLGVAQLFNPGNFNYNKPMGTPATMAPEVWRGTITPKADVYSCGVVLFELLSLKMPLKVPGDRENGSRFWANPPRIEWEVLQPVSQTAEELCRFMMNYERIQRPSAVQCLENAFLRDSLEDDLDALAAGPNASKVSPEILRRLAKMPERSMLYKSIALSIAREWPANQMPTIKRAFQELSKSSAGRLDIMQVSSFLQSLGVKASLAHKVADAMDLNRDGNVDFTEFVAACTYLGSDEFEKYLWDIFQEADSDDDNLLSQNDISKLLPLEHTGETVRDIFQGLTGRTEPGARVDWPTFKRHFKSGSVSRKAEAKAAGCTPPATGPTCQAAAEPEQPWAFGQGLEQAFDFVEKVTQGLFSVAGGSRATTPARGSASAQGQCPTPARGSAAPRGSATPSRGPPAGFAPAERRPGGRAEVQEEDLRRLAEMGFKNRERCVAVLQRHRNELSESAVEELVRQ